MAFEECLGATQEADRHRTRPAACSNRSLHAYLIDALAAHTRGDPAPLLA